MAQKWKYGVLFFPVSFPVLFLQGQSHCVISAMPFPVLLLCQVSGASSVPFRPVPFQCLPCHVVPSLPTVSPCFHPPDLTPMSSPFVLLLYTFLWLPPVTFCSLPGTDQCQYC